MTSHSALTDESEVQAHVMVAVPSATAVTNPAAETVAIASSEELQVTVLVVAVAGVTVAVSCSVSLAARLTVSLLSSTLVGKISTVTPHVSLTDGSEEQAHVIVTVPAATAVTKPALETVAIASLEEDQITVFVVVVAGVTVASS